jgi:hypothetical protein
LTSRPTPGPAESAQAQRRDPGTRTRSPGGEAVSRETSQSPRRSRPWSARVRPVSARRLEAQEGRRGSGRVKAGWGKPLEGLKNPRRGSAPIVRCNSRRPEYGLPIRAETPEGPLETDCVLAHGAETAPRSGAGHRAATRRRVELGRPLRRPPTEKVRRGKGCREASRRSEGKTL